MPTFCHSGDCGDILYALPSIRALGGGVLYLAERSWTRSRWTGQAFENLRALLEAQTYIEGVRLHRGEEIDHDFSTFRNGGYRLGDTIFERQRRWVRADARPDEPWLKVPGAFCPHNRVVAARSLRWTGFHFPWAKINQVFSPLFVGTAEEHRDFEKNFGKIERRECASLLEVAQVVAGGSFFIGDQSAPNAIANALGKPSLLEVCPYAPDCFLIRPDAAYSFSGEVELNVSGRSLRLPAYHPPRGYLALAYGRKFRSDEWTLARLIASAWCAFLKKGESIAMAAYQEKHEPEPIPTHSWLEGEGSP